jgi:REP element-mobilizing transposase RayT
MAMNNRRSIRLQAYDYASEGAYFITICTTVRQPWFGDVRDEIMHLNDAGSMVHVEWQNLAMRFPQIELDTFIIMPDHIHGIICITNDAPPTPEPHSNKHPHGTIVGSIGRIIQAFKSITTNTYIQAVHQYGWQAFPGKLWQRNYYEHIIRNEHEHQGIREYILHNPLRWRKIW